MITIYQGLELDPDAIESWDDVANAALMMLDVAAENRSTVALDSTPKRLERIEDIVRGIDHEMPRT